MKKQVVWTPSGLQYGTVNSLVGKGESLINYNAGKATLVTKGKIGVDNQPSSVTSDDDNVIAGNDPDWIGYYSGKTSLQKGLKRPQTFAEQVAPITTQIESLNAVESKFQRNNKKPELDSLSGQTAQVFQNNMNKQKQPLLQMSKAITDRQQLQHDIQDKHPELLANCGKDLRGFDAGKTSRQLGSIPSVVRYGAYATPAILNGLQALYWARQKVHAPNIYASNPYEQTVLQRMAQRHADPYAQFRAMQDAERRGIFSLNQSGGYTGGQRQLARVAQNIGLQRNYADVLANVNREENQYISDWATLAANLGAQQAQRRQSANQYNAESYDRAASRRATNMWKSVAGVGQAIQQGFANENQYQSFQDLMNMYNHKMSNDELELMLRYPQGKPDNTPTVTTSDGAGTYVRNSSSNIFSKTAPTGYKWTNRGRGIREMIVDPEYIDANPSLQKYWNDNYGPFIVIPGTTNTQTPGAYRGGDYVNSIFPKITFE